MPLSIEKLIADGPMVSDGAWGTEFQARGLAVGDSPDTWNLSKPEQVIAVAKAYVDAGSQIILTNTFGANRLRLAESGAAADTVEINRAGVELSRRAAGDRALVFASIGASGKILMMGDTKVEDLQAAFEEQAQALSGADAIVIETMSELDEARLAVSAARATGLPVVACMVFDSGANKDYTMMGVTPEETAEILTEAGADVIGANCGQGIAGFVSICKRLHSATDRPIWIKANAGTPELIDGELAYRTGPEEFAAFAGDLIAAGASFLGGCCGTNPEFIRALKKEVIRLK
jgi:5-methyltetrahydrofolate--homocysteine methyltransferase